MNVLEVEVVSDFICAWCYIAAAQLKAAAQLADVAVDVRWLPYEINPSMPTEGQVRRDYRAEKFGSWERAEAMDAAVAVVAAAAGLAINFERIKVTPNTRLAHRLAWFAPDDKRAALVAEIFRAYFERGEDIGQLQVLVPLAGAAGIDVDDARAFLSGNAGTHELLALERRVLRTDVTSVPRIRIAGRELQGAVGTEALERALREAVRT